MRLQFFDDFDVVPGPESSIFAALPVPEGTYMR